MFATSGEVLHGLVQGFADSDKFLSGEALKVWCCGWHVLVRVADQVRLGDRDEQLRSATLTKTLEQSTILYTSSPSARARGPAFDSLINQANVVRGWGDCYGYALIATGRADVMLDARMNPWDCAPLLPILEESGGRFTDWKGERTIYGDDCFGTNGLLHETVLEVLKGAA